jgi:hypothetical protein
LTSDRPFDLGDRETIQPTANELFRLNVEAQRLLDRVGLNFFDYV